MCPDWGGSYRQYYSCDRPVTRDFTGVFQNYFFGNFSPAKKIFFLFLPVTNTIFSYEICHVFHSPELEAGYKNQKKSCCSDTSRVSVSIGTIDSSCGTMLKTSWKEQIIRTHVHGAQSGWGKRYVPVHQEERSAGIVLQSVLIFLKWSDPDSQPPPCRGAAKTA